MILFRFPLPMFQKILPQLESNFLQDEKSLNLLTELVDRRYSYNPFGGEYIYTEVMIFWPT